MMNFYLIVRDSIYFIYFFFNDTATTEIYTLSLHDALPICEGAARHGRHGRGVPRVRPRATGARGDQDAPARGARSEEHTSELQSRLHLVCRLLLEKKKKYNMSSPSLQVPDILYITHSESVY